MICTLRSGSRFQVDEDGGPVGADAPTVNDAADDRPYYCGNCGDEFLSWSEARQHVKVAA